MGQMTASLGATIATSNPSCANTGTPSATARLVAGSSNSSQGAAGNLLSDIAAPELDRAHALDVLPAVVRRLPPDMLGTLLTDLVVVASCLLVTQLVFETVTFAVAALYFFLLFTALLGEGAYRQANRVYKILVKAVLGSFCLLALTIQFNRAEELPALVAWSILNLLLLCAWREVWRRVQVTSHKNSLVVGPRTACDSVIHAIDADPNSGRCVKALFPGRILWQADSAEAFSRLAREEHIDEVIIANADAAVAKQVVAVSLRNSLDIKLAPELPCATAVSVECVRGIPLITLRSQPAPEWALAVKRILDVCGAFALGIAALPLLAFAALLIKLDSAGPVFYSATRIGRKGERFTCYKLRTMVTDSDSSKPGLRLLNQRQGAFFKMADDPRLTKLGKWFRKYSVDELPQLWNVLRGEMSLVGPRPHPHDDVQRYRLGDLQRLDFLPGMTGLWQVTAREDPSFARCVALDVEYIQHWSLLLDLRILVRTVAAVARGSGA